MNYKFLTVIFTIIQWAVLFLPNAVRANAFEISIEKKAGSSIYKIHAKLLLHASQKTVWKILTDYERLPSFIPQISESKIVQKVGNSKLLAQVGREVIFFVIRVTFRVLLEIREIPYEQISFRDTARKDFAVFEGKWRILNKAQFMEISYFLDAEPKFEIFEFFTKSIIRNSIESIFFSLKSEIERTEQQD
jgi:ribosome-associated toxin RatA of RatAB toxin-antitoxin module